MCRAWASARSGFTIELRALANAPLLQGEMMTLAPVGPVRYGHRLLSWAVCPAIVLFTLAACTSFDRPISYAPGQPIPLRSFTVELPASRDWQGRDLGSVEEEIYLVFGRELDSTRTVVAAATDLVAEERKALYEAKAAGKPDPERLEFILDLVQQNAQRAEPGTVERFWRGSADRPVVKQGVACQEYGYETLDRRVPSRPGEPFRMVLRGLACLDPETGRPIQVTYSERYIESIEGLRPEFESEVNAYFNSLSVDRTPS
jgi:hypothetical protein